MAYYVFRVMMEFDKAVLKACFHERIAESETERRLRRKRMGIRIRRRKHGGFYKVFSDD